MPLFTSKDGEVTVDTTVPREMVQLRAQGFTEQEPFDPAEANAADVVDYLSNLDESDPAAHDAEVARVVESERAGKARKSVLEAADREPTARYDKGGELTSGLATVTNDTGQAEAIVPSPKSIK